MVDNSVVRVYSLLVSPFILTQVLMSEEGLFVLFVSPDSHLLLIEFFFYFNFSFVPKLVVMDMNLLPYLMPSMMPQHLMLRVRTITLGSSQELITCLLWVKSTTQMGEVGI